LSLAKQANDDKANSKSNSGWCKYNHS